MNVAFLLSTTLRVWVPDPVGDRFVGAEAPQHSFPGLGFHLLGILNVDESSSADHLDM